MPPSDDTDPPGPQRLRLGDLPGRKPTRFRLEPDAAARAALAAEFDLLALRKLVFAGSLTRKGKGDWELSAMLGATVTQPCVATLAPVTTRIDEKVERLYSAHYTEPEEDEAEIPEDDRLEPLPETLDLGALMAEALALALPLYPRAADPGAGDAIATPPGAAPLTDAAAHPFAGLRALQEMRDGDGAGDGADDAAGDAPRKS